ncbi:MAG TPA: glycosyltransferase [Methylococcus sp.]|nr:glycosyltransferase [Methylococcus sp.]
MNEKSLKVLHYSPVWLPLTEPWLYEQVRSLPEWIENHVVCRSIKHLEQFDLPNIHCLKRDRPVGYLLHRAAFLLGQREGFLHFDRILRAVRPDLVHSHFGNNGWTVHRTVHKLGLPHVITFYGQDVSKLPTVNPEWRRRYLELFADENTIYLCEGGAMAKALAGLGCPPERIRVHHLGVPLDRIRFEPRAWTPGASLKVLIAASFHERKGIPDALEALARLCRELPVEITVIGDAVNSRESREEKRRILEVIERRNLRPAVRMLGFQPHEVLWREAYAHHIFLSPSRTAHNGDTEGGAPVALIEMAASGMPIVSTRHCDIPEIILEGKTGWLAEEGDVDGIAECLRRCLDVAPRWPAILAAGREHIESEYDAARQGERLAALYRSLCDRVPRNA